MFAFHVVFCCYFASIRHQVRGDIVAVYLAGVGLGSLRFLERQANPLETAFLQLITLICFDELCGYVGVAAQFNSKKYRQIDHMRALSHYHALLW